MTQLYVLLSNRGNPDIDQDPDKRLRDTPRDRWTKAKSVEHAQKLVSTYVKTYQLGSGNWTGGVVRSEGKIIGHISYDGRFRPISGGK